MSLIKKIILAFGLLLIVAIGFYLVTRWTYAKEYKVTAESRHTTDTLLVGIIGDSYVSGGKLDTILTDALKSHHITNKVISSGQGGANSRLIYENMFLDKSEPLSSNAVLHSNLKYCVVIAGVNDALGQYGAPFYVHHEIMIIRSLLKDNIRPVIVTLPEFGIKEGEHEFNFIKENRNKVFGFFTGNGFGSTIHDYRNKLAEELNKQHLDDSILTVNYDSVVMNYQNSKNLFRNPVHLNLKGNQKFMGYIAKCIANDNNKH